ncbi:MAG: DUF4846 domain-containing protein [Lewinellaceae bacterium]|nr:DUF4846 domain-containing protein [Lewinellaceae bacterium]
MHYVLIFIMIPLFACQKNTRQGQPPHSATLNQNAEPAFTIPERFPAPEGADRMVLPKSSFGNYLRNFALQPDGAQVMLYNGRRKGRQDVHAAILDIDVGNRDLQQCADAVMRLRAEFLYKEKRYSDIHFNFTNGFRADYTRWRNGERIKIDGNRVSWVNGGTDSPSYKSFRQYLNMVFSYAGTASLEKELRAQSPEKMMPGDVFIQGGHPGHAVIVMDVAEDTIKGKKYFLLAQSYMPAQDIHILKNFNDASISPWYEVKSDTEWLKTPEWDFRWTALKKM